MNKNINKSVMDGFKFKWGPFTWPYKTQIEDQIKKYRKENNITADEKIFLLDEDIRYMIKELTK